MSEGRSVSNSVGRLDVVGSSLHVAVISSVVELVFLAAQRGSNPILHLERVRLARADLDEAARAETVCT